MVVLNSLHFKSTVLQEEEIIVFSISKNLFFCYKKPLNIQYVLDSLAFYKHFIFSLLYNFGLKQDKMS